MDEIKKHNKIDEETLKNLKIMEREEKANSFTKKLLRNKTAVIGLVIIAITILCALLAPILSTHDPNKVNTLEACLGPGEKGHILGTDEYGRDLYSRIVYGSRISIIVGVCATSLGALLGIILGIISGYKGGTTDAVIMRLMDGMFAFPFILLAIVMMTVFGSGLQNVVLAIGIANIPSYARIVRGQVLIVKEQEYCHALVALGASNKKIIMDHILPNILSPIVVYATLNIAGAIISEAALSFLGLGIQPPTPSWGNILKSGKDYLITAPHIATFSGLAILITVLGFNLFGDGVRDALDPKLKQ